MIMVFASVFVFFSYIQDRPFYHNFTFKVIHSSLLYQ